MAEEINEHRIYVGGLYTDVSLESLERAFSTYGEVCNVSLNERRRFGFVSYRHKREAQMAIVNIDGSWVIGNPARVEWAFGWPIETSDESDNDSEEDDFLRVYNETDSDNTTVFCGGLSDITRDLLKRTFQPFGEIEEITCFDDSREYAFVRFATKEAATSAICPLNNTLIDDELITLLFFYSFATKEAATSAICPLNNTLIDDELITLLFFYSFATKEAATKAATVPFALNNTLVDYDLITVDWSHNPHVRSTIDPLTSLPLLFDLGAPSTSSESSRSSSPILQDAFDIVMSRTTPNNRTVYVGGLKSYVAENVIRSNLSQYGDIEEVNLFHNYGFIRFSTKVSAALAICARDQHNIYEGEVRCDWAHRQQDDPPQPVEAAAPSTSVTPRVSQLQSEPDIHYSGLAIASVPESVEPNNATNAKETEVEEKVEVTKVDKKVEETKTVDLQCKICMDEQVGVVFLPCGHLASCPRCAQRISNCPMCRRGITKKVRTYLS
ncbi:hypothetical protein JTE90_019714 [Oedothorax gibbosus]|uniref:Uncharacterized protein n=1 Tax=Oedothorax gibbosus TaxID=931172 RepID=A0AAV6TVJ2_9ARAC|nr:hypothetical protein JTE90_019714 [Oedothorax gibbosus]